MDERTQLVEEFEEYGGNKDSIQGITNLDSIRQKVFEQKGKYEKVQETISELDDMRQSDYIDTIQKYGINPDSSKEHIAQLVLMHRHIDEREKELSENVYKPNQEEKTSGLTVEQSLARIERLKAQKKPDLQGDELTAYNNELEKQKNNLRSAYGIEERKLKISDADILALLDSDLIDEYIDSLPDNNLAEKHRIQKVVKEETWNRDLEQEKKERKEKFYRDMTFQISRLADLEPEPVIKHDNGHVETNPDFNKWVDRCEALENRMKPKIMAIEQNPNDYLDKNPDIVELIDKIAELKK